MSAVCFQLKARGYVLNNPVKILSLSLSFFFLSRRKPSRLVQTWERFSGFRPPPCLLCRVQRGSRSEAYTRLIRVWRSANNPKGIKLKFQDGRKKSDMGFESGPCFFKLDLSDQSSIRGSHWWYWVTLMAAMCYCRRARSTDVSRVSGARQL